MKYKIGSIVRIKATGEKVKIVDRHILSPFKAENEYFCDKYGWMLESELKPYRPSRLNGKIRDEKGRLRTKTPQKDFQLWSGFPNCRMTCQSYYGDDGKLHNCTCGKCEKMNPTPEKIEKIEIVHTPIGQYPLYAKLNQLIDANSSLEERVKELEKQVESLYH